MTNTNILHKCDILSNLFPELLKTHAFDSPTLLEQKAEEIHKEYNLGSVRILNEFFSLNTPQCSENTDLAQVDILKNYNKKRTECLRDYNSFIQEENIIGRLNDLFEEYKHVIANLIASKTKKGFKYHQFGKEFRELCKKYEETLIRYDNPVIIHALCDTCKCKMTILSNTSEIRCDMCGFIKELNGTVFEDDQFYYQEGQRSKHGSYDPTKHCRFWLRRIQAREYVEIDENVLDLLKNCILRDNIVCKRHISCDKIRNYLRETKNSQYNEYVPLIRKILTGISPPQLTDVEVHLTINYFTKVIHIFFGETKSSKKINCPYHPYFIYKILEQIIPPPKGCNDYRKQEILSCIHLQSRDTLIENDRIWKPICEKIPEFTYVPTDRNTREIDY